MLTKQTRIVIAILNDISSGKGISSTQEYALQPEQLTELLLQLIAAGLIRPLPLSSGYELTRSAASISLLDILIAIDAKLEYNCKLSEEMYSQYRTAAIRLGVIHSITRVYLAEIKLTDF